MRIGMPTGQVISRWQGIVRWSATLGVAGMLALFGLLPQGAGAQNTGPQQAHSSLRPDLPISTPDPGSPAFSLSPNSGPVGTTVSFQGSGWPAKSIVLLK